MTRAIAALLCTLAMASAVGDTIPIDPVPGYARNDINIVAGNIVMVIAPCEEASPEFVARHGRVLEAYRRRHAAAIAYLQTKKDFVATEQEYRKHARAHPKAGSADLCNDIYVAATLKRLARDHDPRFATPEGAWAFLRKSLAAGNREEALLVVTGGNFGLAKAIRNASEIQLGQAAAGMGELSAARPVPTERGSVDIPVEGARRPASFERVFGEWYVSDGLSLPREK